MPSDMHHLIFIILSHAYNFTFISNDRSATQTARLSHPARMNRLRGPRRPHAYIQGGADGLAYQRKEPPIMSQQFNCVKSYISAEASNAFNLSNRKLNATLPYVIGTVSPAIMYHIINLAKAHSRDDQRPLRLRYISEARHH
eukprot:scaffold343758_cov32-Prasinocladus_malaysianus.AAC.2